MKKILAMAMAMVLCLTSAVGVLAAGSGTGSAGEADVCLSVDATGNELSVKLIANTAVTDGTLTVSYDADAVSISDTDYTVAGIVTMHSLNIVEDGTLKVAWISKDAVTGTLFTFDFTLAEGAEITADTFALEGIVLDAEENEATLGVDTDIVDKTVLQSLYDASLTLAESDYTEESWDALEAARENALAVLDDGEATQAEVDAAAAELINAIAGLVAAVEDEVDKTVLQAACDATDVLLASSYTEESWEVFAVALNAAQAVLKDENATQEEVDEALNTLLVAMGALTLKADASEEDDPTTAEDDTTAAEDDTTVAEDDTTAAEGDTTAAEGDTTAAEGDATAAEGDATAAESDTTAAADDTTAAEAEETTAAAGSDSTGGTTTGTGDDAPVRALAVTLVIAGMAIAVLLAGKKKFAKQ